MTLDEAIRHCEEKAAELDVKAMCVEEAYQTTEQQNCEQCAADHRQLAEWLRELKEAKKFIRKVENELMKGTSFYSTSFLEENRELFDKLTKGVEYLDD